jgi:hypothetical protein
MMDKGLGTFLAFLFGMAGVTTLILAWVVPMPASDRILTAFVGAMGLLWVLIRLLLLRSAASVATGKVPAEVKVKHESNKF